MNPARRLWHAASRFLPVVGFRFDRPLLVLQSDDWGRAGLRDQEGLEALQAAGITLGECPYDLYTLETAADLHALRELLAAHCDSTGRPAVLGMNFVVSNLDLPKMKIANFQRVQQLPLAEGLPSGWSRPGLADAYRDGIAQGVFFPALHGTTHFCQQAVERSLAAAGERAQLLRTFWEAGTPYIHWRMPWIGYEYWDPEQPADQRFLPPQVQQDLIGAAVGGFVKMFSRLPTSACAPGYRADRSTHQAWARHGIHVTQGGPGSPRPPHIDRDGLLQLSRTVEFEPAVQPGFSVHDAVTAASRCLDRGLPAVVSIHSINFHSTIRDFRSRTLAALSEFLLALNSRHPNLLYLDDNDLYQLVQHGSYETASGRTPVKVTRTRFSRAELAS
jgi:hypothetical protein